MTIELKRKLLKTILKIQKIEAVRVSSAKASGAAKQFPYWGVADYIIKLRKKDGEIISKSISAAPSSRRVYRLAVRDAKDTGKVIIDSIGRLSDEEVDKVLKYVVGCG